MPRSVDGGELFKDAVVSFPKLFKHGFHFLNIVLIDTVRGVYSTSNLIEIVACATEQRDHISEFGQIQFDHISVDSHFAKIRSHIDCVSLFHTLINLFVNSFRKEQEIAIEKKPSVLKKLNEAKTDLPKKSPGKAKEAEL